MRTTPPPYSNSLLTLAGPETSLANRVIEQLTATATGGPQTDLPAELFARQTYYALLTKLLALATASPARQRPLRAMLPLGSNSAALRELYQQLETGELLGAMWDLAAHYG